jgi:hypothetical protein
MKPTKLLAGLLLATLACYGSATETESADFSRLSSGTSFGMCAGYCRTELLIDSTSATLTETSWDHPERLPPRITSLELNAAEWQRIRRQVNPAALTRLAGVHGCPDCADGGAEWIELRTDQALVRVTFEYGQVLNEISGLQAEIRALRGRLQP